MQRKIIPTLLFGFIINFSLHPIDIKQAFFKIKHPAFFESIGPLIYENFYEADGRTGIIHQFNLQSLFQEISKTGIVDLKNQYIFAEKHDSVNVKIREFLLLLTAENTPVFIGTELNIGQNNKLSTEFALCQDRELVWNDCTSQVFPKYSISQFLRSDQRLNPRFANFFHIHFEFPDRGQKIIGRIVCDEYAFLRDSLWKTPKEAEQGYRKEMAKFKVLQTLLIWDKRKGKLLAQ